MHCLKIINIIIWRILKFYDEKMKKSLIVAMLSMLLSVNVLTPMSYAVENVWELSGIAENGGENAENGANGSSWTEGEGFYVWNTQDSSAEPQNDDNTSSWTEGEGSYEWQTWNQLDSSAEPQNDDSDEQVPQNDDSDAQDSSVTPQKDWQDEQTSQNDWKDAPAPVDPEDPIVLPLAQSMPAMAPLMAPAPSQANSTTGKDLHLYFVNGSETKHYTIMDRNMGATEVWDEWYYYQWWNNYGFTPWTFTTTKVKIPYEEWKDWIPWGYYYDHAFITNGYSSVDERINNNWQEWTSDQRLNSNLWWWADDTLASNWAWTKVDRKWPCPDWYYVPSAFDHQSLKNIRQDSTTIPKSHTQFAKDLLIPIAWSLELSAWSRVNNSSDWYLWTSSPTWVNNAYRVNITSNQFSDIGKAIWGGLGRASWNPVRCFKDDFKPEWTTPPLNIHLEPGQKTVIAVDADGKIQTLNDALDPSWSGFKWWYTTENFLNWTKVKIGDTLSWTDLYARWEGQEESFVVTFKNYDGTVLQTWAVASGSVLSGGYYTWAEPTKPFTAQTWYYFTGWTPDFATITGETTYTAKFEERVNKYTVTFVDEDGTTVLKEATEYEYGTASGDIVKPADPTKAATAQYTYTFAGWTPELAEVTWNVTYKATYSSTVNKYTVTVVSNNTLSGTVSPKSITVPYGTSIDTGSSVLKIWTETSTATETPDTDQYDFSFVDWTNNCGATVTTWCTITANFKSEVKKYEITWLNDDGILIDTTTVEYWVVPTHADATKENTAEYTYTFSGWTPEVVAVTGEATYKATFSSTKNKYTVTFKDADWNVISEEEIEYGQTPTAPADPTKEWHTFAGWNPVVWPVTGDVNYEPTFTINKHTVTWQNYDGTELEKDVDVDYWTTPTYDWATPTRDADAQYTYTFAAWSPAISTVKGDIVYKATYSTTVNEYPVTFLDEDGTELYKYSVPYGMMPLYTGDIPTKEADSKYTYTFAGWTPSLAAVTWDATYTVKFNSKKKWGNRSGGWKWGNSDSNTHGSADEQDSSTTSQNDSSSLSWTDMNDLNWEAQELFDVHKWAYENWLTKFGDINDARMNDPITRSEMAKISSIFDTNFLGKTPDESKESECSSYPDIQNMGGDLHYFVVQSCELWNMWYSYDNENHIENFMPYNPLNVAQASVILSRMAWWKKYIISPEKWYQWHMYAVYEHVLIDDTSDPWRHITRREAFTAFYRLDKLLKEKK